MKIAIVEDTSSDLIYIQDCLVRLSEEKNVPIQVSTYHDSLLLLSDYNMQFDCIFMDIQVPGVNGMEGAKKLRQADPTVPVIFVTNLENYAIQGYSVNAFDYIIKPYTYEKIKSVWERLFSKIHSERSNDIFIKNPDGVIRIPINLLYYVSVEKHCIYYHTAFGVFQERSSMKSAEEALLKYDFTRINSCYLVNMRYIENVCGDEVWLREERLKISRARKKKLLSDINEYILKNQ